MEEINEVNIKIKELEFIQNIIHRMSDRQHTLKLLYCCITACMFTVSMFYNSYDAPVLFMFATWIFTYIFYRLDTNFLQTERLYRLWQDFIRTKQGLVLQLDPAFIKKTLIKEDISLENVRSNSFALNLYEQTVFGMSALYLISLSCRLIFTSL